MDQSNRAVSGNLPLDRVVANALGEIERLGYSRRSRNRYRAIWTHFIEFSRQNKLGDEFSGNLAARFVEEYGVRNEEADKPGEGWRRHIVFGVKVLADFVHHGRIERVLSPTWKRSIFIQPWRRYFGTTNSTVRTDFSFGRRLFERAPENSRSFWIFWIREKRGPWAKSRRWICLNSCLRAVT